MELYQYILIGVGVVLILSGVVVVFLRTKEEKKEYNLPNVLELLDKKNIESVEFIRNKIVISFTDVTKFDTQMLHDKGAKGISIVGDKVKFFFDGDNELNEMMYQEIKKYIEG